MLTEY